MYRALIERTEISLRGAFYILIFIFWHEKKTTALAEFLVNGFDMNRLAGMILLRVRPRLCISPFVVSIFFEPLTFTVTLDILLTHVVQ